MYAITFGLGTKQFGDFPTTAKAKWWGFQESSGETFQVVVRTQPY